MSRLRVAVSAGLALGASVALAGGHPWQTQVGPPSNLTGSVPSTVSAQVGNLTGATLTNPATTWTNRVPGEFKTHCVPVVASSPERDHSFECAATATPEGEPPCGADYVDTYNGGCNSSPPAFQNIASGSIVRGESGFYYSGSDLYRDTDWYQVVLTEPSELTYTVLAEFPLQIVLIDGGGGCGAVSVLAISSAEPCKSAVIGRCLPVGTYWLVVVPQLSDGQDPADYPCGKQYCAELAYAQCSLPVPIACPPDAYPDLWQLAYGADEPWALYVSNDRFPDQNPANGVLLYEHFAGIGGAIEDIHWWGVSAVVDDGGALLECPLHPGQFHIGFWLEDERTNRPDYAIGEVYGFDVTGTALTKTDTGHVYRVYNGDGSLSAEYRLWSWSCELPAPLTMFRGWVTIQNIDDCPFWWAGSPGPVAGGGGIHVAEDQSVSPATRQDAPGDLSYCLTAAETGPFTGACCAVDSGVCRYTTADECTRTYEEFYLGWTCSEVGCTPEVWACCLDDGYSAYCELYSAANCTGAWYRYYVCSPIDPGYDPEAFGGAGNVITCVSTTPCSVICDYPVAFGRPLSGGELRISWDRAADDRRYVIDSFDGFGAPIRSVKWWGNSAIAWDGPDCDFEDPAPFVIRFYHTSAGGPRLESPAGEYDPVYARFQGSGAAWEEYPELGEIDCYRAVLPTAFVPGTGTQWISIASKSADCDFVWAPGTGSTPGQWFINNGVVQVSENEHRSFCLHTNISTGACCSELTGVCIDGTPESNCLGYGQFFYARETCASIPQPCTLHTGACCDHERGDCTLTSVAACAGVAQVWLGLDSTCAECCVALCPAGGIPEGEPPCGPGYIDTFNAGCFTRPPESAQFRPIHEGETICGRTGVYTDAAGDACRDLDFYSYSLSEPCAVISATVRGEFRPDVWLMAGQCFTDSWCGQEETYVLTYARATAAPCEEAVVSAALAGLQSYYIMVSCYGGDVLPETPYTLEIETQPAGECVIGDTRALRSEAVCLVLGGVWAPWRPCMAHGDANCDGAVNVFDIDPFVLGLIDRARWEATYSCDYFCAIDCNGDGFVNVFDIDPFVVCLTGGSRAR